MKKQSFRSRIFFFTLLVLSYCLPVFAADTNDPIAAEISRLQAFVKNNHSTDEDWTYLQGLTSPLLAKASTALEADRKYFALHLLALVRPMLDGRKYTESRPKSMHEQISNLEEEWKRVGGVLAPYLEGKKVISFEGRPAVVRAIGEAAFMQIRPYYEASLEYGKNTIPDAGLYYLGAAQAQMEMARFCSTLDFVPENHESVKIENLQIETDAFEDELLAQYKPPASIDSHPVFIRTNALLKESRELQNGGNIYGSFYRLLDARLRLTKITMAGSAIDAQEASGRAAEMQKTLSEHPADHSIAQLFIQMALTEAEDTTPDSKGKETARAIFEDVLPHYFSVIGPPKPRPQQQTPEVTVTLLRWPYT